MSSSATVDLIFFLASMGKSDGCPCNDAVDESQGTLVAILNVRLSKLTCSRDSNVYVCVTNVACAFTGSSKCYVHLHHRRVAN